MPKEDLKDTISPLKFGQSKVIFAAGREPNEANTELVRDCLNNHDGGSRTNSDIDEMPYPQVRELIVACLEINGLKTQKGEAEPAKTTE